MQESQHNIRSGAILGNYKIIRVLGEGGFGITYLAKDTSLALEVVIKEYFPNEFAIRSGDSTITAKSKSIDDFKKGKQRFKEEAQVLAKFSHPSIVKILGYFEANDTAYFVMEYEEGIDLSQYLKQKGTPLKQEEILSIMMPILEGLKEVHAHNYLHRDIKPGNILLRSNNSPVLIDFGASKLALGEASK
ncbi:MAG: serine/threonine-protein kinase, partial [Actinomycetota bacterium]|nr:serine/threonine-protein kinase [Actinomycetota bacterium]